MNPYIYNDNEHSIQFSRSANRINLNRWGGQPLFYVDDPIPTTLLEPEEPREQHEYLGPEDGHAQINRVPRNDREISIYQYQFNNHELQQGANSTGNDGQHHIDGTRSSTSSDHHSPFWIHPQHVNNWRAVEERNRFKADFVRFFDVLTSIGNLKLEYMGRYIGGVVLDNLLRSIDGIIDEFQEQVLVAVDTRGRARGRVPIGAIVYMANGLRVRLFWLDLFKPDRLSVCRCMEEPHREAWLIKQLVEGGYPLDLYYDGLRRVVGISTTDGPETDEPELLYHPFPSSQFEFSSIRAPEPEPRRTFYHDRPQLD